MKKIWRVPPSWYASPRISQDAVTHTTINCCHGISVSVIFAINRRKLSVASPWLTGYQEHTWMPARCSLWKFAFIAGRWTSSFVWPDFTLASLDSGQDLERAQGLECSSVHFLTGPTPGNVRSQDDCLSELAEICWILRYHRCDLLHCCWCLMFCSSKMDQQDIGPSIKAAGLRHLDRENEMVSWQVCFRRSDTDDPARCKRILYTWTFVLPSSKQAWIWKIMVLIL